jgi:RNA polymerase sigma factor (sigma-70 family)
VKAQLSDRTLVERLLPSRNDNRQDRADAWSEWYAQVGHRAVLSFVRAKNDTTEQDMDIVQEAMTIAYLEVERGRYQPRAGIPFAAYVKGIARNKIREARRRCRRYVLVEDVSEHLAARLPSDGGGARPEAIVVRREQAASLRAGLSRLTPYRRRVLEGYLGGRSTTEIARTLGLSEAAVRQHKSRGLRSLRQMGVVA